MVGTGSRGGVGDGEEFGRAPGLPGALTGQEEHPIALGPLDAQSCGDADVPVDPDADWGGAVVRISDGQVRQTADGLGEREGARLRV